MEHRLYTVRTYWKAEYIKGWQRQLMAQFGVQKPPTASFIQCLVNKLETRILLDVHGGRPKLRGTVRDVKDKFLAFPKKSLRKLFAVSGVSTCACQWAAKAAKLLCTVLLLSKNWNFPTKQKGLIIVIKRREQAFRDANGDHFQYSLSSNHVYHTRRHVRSKLNKIVTAH